MKKHSIHFHLSKTVFRWKLSGVCSAIILCSSVAFAGTPQNINHITEKTSVSFKEELIKGRVTDEQGNPVPFATIYIKGTQQTAQSDENGNFEIRATIGDTLIVEFIGYEPSESEITENTLNIVLKTRAEMLDELVVEVGYGNKHRSDLTGAISQLDPGTFKDGVNISPDQLLQGKVSGIRVVQTSGEPGAGVDVSIRGIGSIRSGSTPLFVVDGMPLSNESVSPEGSNVGFGTSGAKNPLNFLNASDIESMTVLKDASAAAIYGARGSNGVVIITTKKGTSQEPTFTFDSSLGFSNVIKKLSVLSADEYRKRITEPAFDHGGNTDWQDIILRTAVTRNNSLSFGTKSKSGGNYFVSISNLNQEGIINKSDFNRNSARFNAEEKFFDDRLTIKANLTASEIKENGVPTSDDGGSDGQLMIHTLMANPTWSVFDKNGEYTNFNMNAHYNPAYLLDIYEDETRTLRALANLELGYRILPGLNYKFNFGYDLSNSERNTTIYPNITDRSPRGQYYQSNVESKSYLLEHYLTYDFSVDRHQFDVLGGFSYQYFHNTGNTINFIEIADREDGVSPMDNPGYQGKFNGVSGYTQENELQSYFGRFNYSFDGKYLFTASLRADGSTRFGQNNKYGYFPSFALGWNVNRENFLMDSDIVNNLKIRGSWGQTGNQEVQNKITQASYSQSYSDGYYLNADGELVPGITISRTPNPNLKWEVVTQYNVGVDFSLWDDKLYGTLDYFNKTTTDAILNIPSMSLSPTPDVWVNIDGEIVNKGFEFMLGSNIINKADFSWNIDVNGTFLSNTIKNLPVSQILSGKISGPGQSGVNANIYKSGYALGSFYALDHIGYDEDGRDVFRDVNGDGIISMDDRIIIESAIPDFTFGINSYMNYKNWDFSFSIIGQTGGFLANNTMLNALNINNLASDRNIATQYADSGANISNPPQFSDLYIEKSDFIRLNSVRLGYTVPLKNIQWLDHLNLYMSGQNLVTISGYSGYDPLINSNKATGGNQSIGVDYTSYPTSKTILFGLTLKF
ncbi:SusC/RagA family TonB-linked outer membrane protein [Myroides indicus]|uniref:Iron complex outermembrane receptor protein n=1 Tax=Myroides indicus TaxID=1323422 RepID=A0A4R7F9C5_9FLAO|nr:TonB-dependent receptor [Myroides indicus]TDS63639.1 iron complex outermembrane receptor protein [Myroides indicus]